MSKIMTCNQMGRYFLFLYAFACGISRAASNLAIGLLFCTFIFYCFKNKEVVFEKLAYVKKYFLIFAGAFLLSVVFSQDKLPSFYGWSQFLYGHLVIVYALCFIENKEDIKKLLFLIVFSVSINAIMNIWEWQSGIYRTRGFLGIMDTATLFGITMPMIFVLLLNREQVFENNRKMYPFLLICLVLCAIGIFANKTRVAYLGASIAIFSFLVIEFVFSAQKKRVLAALAALLVFAGLFIGIYNKSILDISMNNTNLSNARRIVMWEYGLDIFKRNFVTGVGIGVLPSPNLPEDSLILKESIKGEYGHIHSGYIQILATTGIIGFSAYVFYFYNAILASIVGSFFRRKNLFWINIMFTSTIYFLINCATDYPMLGLSIYFYMTVIGLCLAYENIDKNSGAKRL